MLPKVSVMIITYNQEDLISETIDSVLKQNYSNLEIVIADDASKDKTPNIIMDYHAKYPNLIVPVLNSVNLGITKNCNAALRACTGDLVAILGGDDIFLPGKISNQVLQFEDSDVVLSYHPVEIFLHQTGEILFVTNQSLSEDAMSGYEIISKGGIPGASSVMVRSSAIPRGGFDCRLPTVSDWLFYIEVGLTGKVVKLNGIFGRYRKHGRGASDRTYELLDESLKTLDIIQEKYPHDTLLKEFCRIGAFRYLLGELYRLVVKKDLQKIKSIMPLFEYRCSKKNVLFIKSIYPLIAFQPTLILMSKILITMKSAIKRRV